MATASMHMVNNMADAYGGGYKINKTFAELIDPVLEEKRTAEEIISNIKEGLARLQ